MPNIGIIGTGKIGSHLTEFLLTSADIKEIHLANRNKDKLEGSLISLRLRGHLLSSKTKIKKLDWEKVNELDLLVICIKDSYDPRRLLQQNEIPEWLPHNLRYVGLLKDLPLIELLCTNRLKNYQGTIAVITNPVEIISYFIAKWIPSAKVLGLGASVDSARISYLIKTELSITINKRDCIVAGEHGNDLIAISKLWRARKLIGLSKKQIADFVNNATSIGFEIVTKLGFTLQDCAPVFADDIKWILAQNHRLYYKSIAIPKKDYCISIPIKFDLEKKIVEYQSFSIQEIDHLEKSKSHIANFVKSLSSNFDL